MDENQQDQPQRPTAPVCPYCRQPLLNVAWLVNAQAGLLTFYHNVPTCMVALNCQLVPPAPASRIALPHDLRPAGLG